VTLAELLKDQGIDPKALLKQPVGGVLAQSGGITVALRDGQLDIHIICQAAK
jgi:hypothetical protein